MEFRSINEHFRYYLENEFQFKSTERYVYISAAKCKSAYSFAYSNLLMNICSDFESLIRAFFGKENDEPMEINEIIELISTDPKLSRIMSERITYQSSDYEELQPFKVNLNNRTNKKSFKWWSAYNMIKHNKVAKIFHANQENVITALAALYALNRYVLFINAEPGKADVFSDDNHYFNLKELKCRAVSASGIIFMDSNT